jgi:hypothetical protein
MTKADVANLLRCCERTVERQVRLNAFPPPQRFGKESLWFQSVVFGWLEQRRERQRQWSIVNEPVGVEAAAKAPDETQPESAATTPKPRASRAKPRRSQAALQSVFTPEQLSRIGKAVTID